MSRGVLACEETQEQGGWGGGRQEGWECGEKSVEKTTSTRLGRAAGFCSFLSVASLSRELKLQRTSRAEYTELEFGFKR